MTPKAQRSAIAEACGWVFIRSAHWSGAWVDPNHHQHEAPPHFTEDLNAMHEAEKVLTEKQQVWYLQKLTQVRFKQGVGGMIGCMIDKTTFATAAQRAEAFLRTIGKWTEP